MLSRIKSNLTYANAMATIAVFIALGGGAYAATKLPANSVGTRQIRNSAVTPKKLDPAAITLFKGQKGDKGDPSSPGPKGEPGATGTVDTSNFYTKGQSDARFLQAGARGTPVLTAHIDAAGSVASYFNATGSGAPTISHTASSGEYFVTIPGYTPDANSVIELTPAPIGTVFSDFLMAAVTAEATPRIQIISYDGGSHPGSDYGFYLVVFR